MGPNSTVGVTRGLIFFASYCVLLVGTARLSMAADETSTLIASGVWADPANWDTVEFPNNGNAGLSYDAIVQGGTVSLDVATPITVDSLSFSSGTIAGNGSLNTVVGLNWTGGSFGGNITLSGGPVSISSTVTKNFFGTVTNQGELSWESGVVFTDENAELINHGTIDLQGNGSSLGSNATNGSRTTNTGTLRRSIGSGSTIVATIIDNTGLIDVQTGTLRFVAGGTASGMHTISSGATLEFSSRDYLLEDGAEFSGEGVMRVSSGTTSIASGTASMQNVALSDGDLGGGNGTIEIGGHLDWTGGDLQNGVVLTETATGTISGTVTKNFFGTVTNQGELSWESGRPRFGTDAELLNGGLLDLQSNGNFDNAGEITNTGTIRRSVGTGTATVNSAVRNDGLIEVKTGTLNFTKPITGSGDFATTFGATLMPNGNLNLKSADGNRPTLTNFGIVDANVVLEDAILKGAGQYTGTLTLRGVTVENTQREDGLSENITVHGDLIVEPIVPGDPNSPPTTLSDTITTNGTMYIRDELQMNGVLLGSEGGNGILYVENGGHLVLERVGDHEGRDVNVRLREGGRISGDGIIVGTLDVGLGTVEGNVDVQGGLSLGDGSRNDQVLSAESVQVLAGAKTENSGFISAGALSIDDGGEIQGFDGTLKIKGLRGSGVVENRWDGGDSFNPFSLDIGMSPGRMTFTNPADDAIKLTLSDDAQNGQFVMEINAASGDMGIDSGWDALVVSAGGITFAGGPDSGITIKLVSLTESNDAGPLADFERSSAYSWRFMEANMGFFGKPLEEIQFLVDDSEFATINDIPSGRFHVAPDGETGLALVYAPLPLLPGDYNEDGVVDAADYTVWRDNLGAPAGTLHNDVDGGVIGQDQYVTWKENFGAIAEFGSGAARSAVPEPNTTALILFGIWAGIRSRQVMNCRRKQTDGPRQFTPSLLGGISHALK